MYGLKQAPREWYYVLADFLQSIGFKHIEADHSVFINYKTNIIMSVYVDDLQIFGRHSPHIMKLKNSLHERFDMVDLGEAKDYLGMEITRDREHRTVRITQGKYIEKVLRRFNMEECNIAVTPMDPKLSLEKAESVASTEDRLVYQSMIGSIMYCMIETRPDIAYATSVLSRFLSNPGPKHHEAAKRVLRYLKGTANHGITYGRGKLDSMNNSDLLVYTDADWGGDHETRRSTGAYVVILYGGAISWSSRRQLTVALSSCEAEYMAQTQATKESIWVTNLLNELDLGFDLPSTPVTIKADNKGAIALSKDARFHTRTKHIDIQWHFVREKVENGTVIFDYCPTGEMAADGLTKALDKVKFGRFVSLMGLIDGNSFNRS